MFFFCIPLIYLKNIHVIHHLPTNGPNPFARFKFGRVFAESADPAWEYENQKFGKELKLDNATKLQAAGYTKPQRDFFSRVARRIFRLLQVDDLFPKGVDLFFYRAKILYQTLKKLHPESELRYTPNGVNPKEFSPAISPLFPKTNAVRYLHVGSVSRRKGVHYLVRAFISSLKDHPQSELFIVGRGEALFIEELKTLSANYPQIRFYDTISNDELPGIYTSADVFCLVPLSGSTPTVLSEALASGLPIITTAQSGSGEVVKEYDTGLVVDPGEVEQLAEAIVYFAKNKTERAAKATNALAASKFFSWDHIAETLIDGYMAVLKKHAHNI